MKYSVKVKPNSKKGPLVVANLDKDLETKSLNTDADLTVYLNEIPKDGEANAGLIKVLAKYFNTAKSNIKIISGEKSKIKRIEVIK